MQEQSFTILLAVVGAGIVVLLTTIIIMCYKWFGQLDSRPHSKKSLSLSSRDVQTHLSDRMKSVEKFSFPDEFCKFMQGVIQTFQAQRKGSPTEFAVLFLSPYRDLKEVSSNIPTEATNCESHTFPADDNLCNYITARPRGNTDDTVSTILGKLDSLMEKFSSEKCQTIVLYTWLLPCDRHTRNCMLQKLRHFSKSKQVIVVYTEKRPSNEVGEKIGITDEEENKIVQEIEAAGILVLKEPPSTTNNN